MKIIVKRVGQRAEVKEIKGTLDNLKEIVGGYIECIMLPSNIICVCNEEGKLLGLKPNFMINEELIVGDVFFCSGKEEEFVSLNDKQIEMLMFMFGQTKLN